MVADTNMDKFELVEPHRHQGSPKQSEMRTATEKLDQLRVEYEIKSPYHLRVGYINYYPTAGTVNLDGQRRFKHTGLSFFLEVLRKEGVLP